MIRAAAVALFAIAATIMGSVPAYAGTYVVKTCGHAPGAVNRAWISNVSDAAMLGVESRCGTGGTDGGLYAFEQLGGGTLPGEGAQAWWTFTAPSGTTIRGARLSRWLRSYADPGWKSLLQADGATLEGCTSFAPEAGECWRGVPGGADVEFPSLSASSVRIGGLCVPFWGGSCDRGATIHSLEVVLYGATMTLEDTQDPTVGAISAPSVADGRWHNDTSTSVTFTATDNTGIRRRGVRIGGIEQLTATAAGPDAATPGCGVPGAGDAYTYLLPCDGVRGLNGSRTITVSLNAGLEGTRTMEGIAVDTGGRTGSGQGVEVKLDRTAPVVSTPAVTGGSAWRADAGAEVGWPVAVETDRAPISEVELELCPAGGPCTMVSKGPAAFGSTLSHVISSLPEGVSSVRVRHTDAAGNVGPWSAPGLVRRDRTAPTVALSDVPGPGVQPGAHLAFAATGTDAASGGVVVEREYAVDDGAWQPYAGAVTAEAGRSYRFRARATDAAGNRSEWQTSGATTVAAQDIGQGPAVAPEENGQGQAVPPATVSPPPSVPTVVPTPNGPVLVRKARTTLVIAAARLTPRRLIVRGRRTQAATGRVTVSFRVAGRSKSRVRRVVDVRGGRFSVTVELPRALRNAKNGTVVVRYAGDARHLPRTASRRVAR
jgi:hypothetical protein